MRRPLFTQMGLLFSAPFWGQEVVVTAGKGMSRVAPPFDLKKAGVHIPVLRSSGYS